MNNRKAPDNFSGSDIQAQASSGSTRGNHTTLDAPANEQQRVSPLLATTLFQLVPDKDVNGSANQ